MNNPLHSRGKPPRGTTLSDLLRLALPMGTVAATGLAYEKNVVSWLVIVTAWSELPQIVQANDLAVIPRALHNSTNEEHLTSLNELSVSAVLVFQPLEPALMTFAHKMGLSILILPKDVDWRMVQRDITVALLDQQGQMREWAMQLFRQLSELSREDQGLTAMTKLMSTLTGKIVVVQDKRLDIRAITFPAGNTIPEKPLRAVLRQRDNMPTILRNRKAAARAAQPDELGQSHWQYLLPQHILPIENVARIVAPIVSGDRARGYVSVIGSAGQIDPFDTLVAEQGAAACALEMAKAKAISEAQKALRGDFLEGLLSGSLPDREIERLERRLDHNTSQPHAVLAISIAGDNFSLRRLETTLNWLLSSHKRSALVHIYSEQHVTIFLALGKSGDGEVAVELDRRLRQHVQEAYPTVTIFTGLSTPAGSLSEWPTRHEQASKAMKLGQRLNLNRLVDYQSLGVYQLLSQIEHLPDVQQFCEQSIGPLVDYDERHNSSLVQTIAAYFNHHANVSQTAESLFVHRNTLLYRLDRIQALTELDLNQPDMRLALQLALKLWQLQS